MLQNKEAFCSYAINDLVAAKHFYSQVLGLSVKENKMSQLELQLQSGNVLLYPKENHQPASFTVLNFLVENIDDVVDALAAKGVRCEQYTGYIQTNEKGICRNENGPAIAWFKDPAGNILSVIEEGY